MKLTSLQEVVTYSIWPSNFFVFDVTHFVADASMTFLVHLCRNYVHLKLLLQPMKSDYLLNYQQ